jgi:hypothetical protein
MPESTDGRELQSIYCLYAIGWLWQAGQPADLMKACLHIVNLRYRDEF